jgi:hypothetical protein
MTIYRLLQRSALTPEDIKPITAAYEECERLLNLAQQSDAVRERLAKAIIEIAQTGVRDPAQIRQLALRQFSAAPPS